MTRLPGITGSLVPGQFLAEEIRQRQDGHGDLEGWRRRLLRWWQRADATTGPATPVREVFDLVAMPLAALLGFRARDARFDRDRVVARLAAPARTPVLLAVHPWSMRPPRPWRDVIADARDIGADWCLIVAPPFVSLMDARGHAQRRSLDFAWPACADARSLPAFLAFCASTVFGAASKTSSAPARIDDLLAKAATFHDRVREDLQHGVVAALASLVTAVGPRSHRHGFDEALTIVYRVLFLLFAESRDLVPSRHPAYAPAYTLTSLCRASMRPEAATAGLWDGLAAITRLSRAGCEAGDLIVRPFNGRLFARAAAPSVEAGARGRRPTFQSTMRDRALARALVALGSRPGAAGRESIAYADLGVEQLGAVYERLLDLDPTAFVRQTSVPAAAPSRGARHSLKRKETGTFYTPQALADFVVRRTLAPLVADAAPDDILALRVVDPAMGSGAFLVAACRYLARAYTDALVRDGHADAADLDADERAGIRRLVAQRCLAGVDVNGTAVQLARLSLWLATLARGRPLTFFDHRLRVGNSIVGASPDDLWRMGPATRDARPLFDAAGLDRAVAGLAAPLARLRAGHDDTVADVRERERLWASMAGDRGPLAPWRLACDLWCARWFWPEADGARAPGPRELRAAIDALVRRDRTLGAERIERWTAVARELSARHGFFHWPLEFADVFYDSTGAPRRDAGFDAIIGNPPWEMVRRDAREDRAGAGEGRRAPGLVEFLRQSGIYRDCGRGHLNLYQPFLERALSLARPGGRVGLVLPWGLASDDGASALRVRMFADHATDTIVGLDNGNGLFPIHRGFRFLVATATARAAPRETRAVFGVRTSAEIERLPDRDDPARSPAYPVRLSPDALRLAGGRAWRVPDARRDDDLDWLLQVSRTFPRLGASDGWGVTFGRELNATEDRDAFGDRGLPVIEGKDIGPFSVDRGGSARRRIARAEAVRRLPGRPFDRPRLAYRDVSAHGNRVALIAAIVPAGVVTTHTLFCLRTPIPLEQQHLLCALFNSAPLDRIVRMLMGSHVTTGLVEDMPVPRWEATPVQRRVADLGRRLTEDATDAALRKELDEIATALYGLP